MDTNDTQITDKDDHKESFELSAATIGWSIAAIVFSIFMCTSNTSAMVLGASFGGKFLAVIAGSILGLVGALIGDAIRKFARPDAIFTNGGMFQLIWNKLFWLYGPQLIGLGLGVATGCAVVLG
jgi:uncharacterized membrane protein YvlD (DUF360 family)